MTTRVTFYWPHVIPGRTQRQRGNTRIMRRWLRLVLALAAVVPCFNACDGGSSADGSTSWLSPCEESSECIGGLKCICGVCTKRCDTSRDCDALEPGAVCTAARGAGDCSVEGATSTVCARRALDAGIPQPGTGGGVSTGGRPARVDAGTGGRAQPETGGAPTTDASSEAATVVPPTLPLGSPEWGDSRTPFCSEIAGNTTLHIQSTPDAVYVVTDSTCHVLDAPGCVPPDPVDNEIFYRTTGRWRPISPLVSERQSSWGHGWRRHLSVEEAACIDSEQTANAA
jgi:hypothetical protein